MPSPGDEAMLYQMIVAAWPALEAIDARCGFTERLADWQLKALREAKLATDWTAPNQEYEDAERSFLYAIMADATDFSRRRATICRAHRSGRCGERPDADAAEADRSGRAGHLSGQRSSGIRAWSIRTTAGRWNSPRRIDALNAAGPPVHSRCIGVTDG